MRPKSSSLFALMLFALCAALIGVTSAWLIPFAQGIVLLPVGFATAAMATTLPAPTQAPLPAFVDANPAPSCSLINTTENVAFVRSAPREDYSLTGLLPVGGQIQAVGYTSNGWYVVNFGERLAWISSSVVSPQTADLLTCNALPLFRNPLIPDAPADAPAEWLSADRDGEAVLHGSISTPGGDTSDWIWVNVINLYSEPPNNYREMVIVLECTGEDVSGVRWGSINAQSLGCGEAINLPFLYTAAQQALVITFAANAPQSYVEYVLQVMQAVG
ncbi:MAG: SH3 domain-containing protein [Anaerolineae bacterium]